MSDFESLKKVFELIESSWHPLDDKRFRDFLRNSKGGLTLGNFRGAFEEAQSGRYIDEAMDKRICELYGKYEKKHGNSSLYNN